MDKWINDNLMPKPLPYDLVQAEVNGKITIFRVANDGRGIVWFDADESILCTVGGQQCIIDWVES